MRGSRYLALLAVIVTAVLSGGKAVEAYTNPFAVGDIDSVNCDSGPPTLNIAIANRGPLPSSLYPGWNNQTLYVASSKADGTYSTNSAKIPNIAAGSEATINVRVDQAKPSYTIAIHATDSAGNTVKLLTGTVIKPANFCAATINDFVNVSPTNLHVASDQKCSSIDMFGQKQTVCIDSQDPGLLLAFDYKYPGSVDGYRLYRVDSNQHTYITSLKSTQMSYTVAQPKTGDFGGFCYAVVAVKLSTESKPSQAYCAKSTDSIHKQVWIPQASRSYCHYGEEGLNSQLKLYAYGPTRVSGSFNAPCSYDFANTVVPGQQPLFVGYAYDTNKGIQDSHENIFVRFGEWWNLGNTLAGHKIVSATYVLHTKSSLVDWSSYSSGGCAQEVTPAGNNWVSDPNGSFDSADFTKAHKFDGLVTGKAYSSSLTETVDVTSFVQSWIDHPSTNYGLVVRNQDENLGVFEERSCYSTVDATSIHVTYR